MDIEKYVKDLDKLSRDQRKLIKQGYETEKIFELLDTAKSLKQRIKEYVRSELISEEELYKQFSTHLRRITASPRDIVGLRKQ